MNTYKGDVTVACSRLVLQHGDEIDDSFFNVMRRRIMRDAKRDMFKTIATIVYQSDIPEDAVRHTIHMLPVKGVGEYELKVSGPRRVTSSDITGEGRVEPDVPIITLARGKQIHLRLRAESVTGAEHPETAPFLFTREGNPPTYVLEPLASIYDKQDCIDAIGDCLSTIRGYTETIESALMDI